MSGTRRVPLNRPSRGGAITAQTVDLFRTAMRLRKRAHRSQAAKEDYWRAERDCERALGIKLWNISPFEDFMFRRGEPPEYLRERGPGAVEDWHHARELRQRLDQALRELERRERTARRAARAAQLVAEPEREPAI
jgi:hypothetical protein